MFFFDEGQRLIFIQNCSYWQQMTVEEEEEANKVYKNQNVCLSSKRTQEDELKRNVVEFNTKNDFDFFNQKIVEEEEEEEETTTTTIVNS